MELWLHQYRKCLGEQVEIERREPIDWKGNQREVVDKYYMLGSNHNIHWRYNIHQRQVDHQQCMILDHNIHNQVLHKQQRESKQRLISISSIDKVNQNNEQGTNKQSKEVTFNPKKIRECTEYPPEQLNCRPIYK